MSNKDAITDYSQTASENTDIGGTDIRGSAPGSNIDDFMRKIMAQMADMNAGAAPLNDTFSVRNPDDITSTARLDAGNVPTATARALDAEALNRNGAYIETRYTADGTHTFAASSRYFQIEAVGGGAGGGGADGQGASTYAAAGGGSSGVHGISAVLAIGSIATGTVVIGTGGAGGAGSGGSNGSNGTATTWDDGTNSLTWREGRGGIGSVGNNGDYARAKESQVFGSSTGVIGSAQRGAGGYVYNSVPSGVPVAWLECVGGHGGDSPYGTGGLGGDTNNAAADGSPGIGYGSGGGGAISSNVNTNAAGGAGMPGILIVREW